MQRRRQSGDLDVFGATRYFDGLADLATGPVTVREPEDQTIQVKMEQMEEGHHSQLAAKTKSSHAAAFFCSLVSPETSFRKNPRAESSATASHDEPHKVSLSFSRGRSDIVIAAAGCGHDLGVMMGDRRLQGVRVVRGAGGDEDRWVVRCGALEEARHEKMFDAPSSVDHPVEGGEDGDDRGWDSDSSSDLFELYLGDTNH